MIFQWSESILLAVVKLMVFDNRPYVQEVFHFTIRCDIRHQGCHGQFWCYVLPAGFGSFVTFTYGYFRLLRHFRFTIILRSWVAAAKALVSVFDVPLLCSIWGRVVIVGTNDFASKGVMLEFASARVTVGSFLVKTRSS